jgi:itaconyl-CoA hydratase
MPDLEGPFFEDFKMGAKLRHSGGRTITDTDNIWFSLLTCNTNQIHYNKEYAKNYFSDPPFNGQLVVNSLLTFSIVLGLSVNDTSKNGIMLGIKDWKATNPVFAGDTITSESDVIATRESKSHPTMGVVTVRSRGFKQGKIPVIEFERTFMVRRRDAKWK